MGFHTLRREVGDEHFRKFLARFYRDFKGKRASFDDVRRTMEAMSGQDRARFFADWIERLVRHTSSDDRQRDER